MLNLRTRGGVAPPPRTSTSSHAAVVCLAVAVAVETRDKTVISSPRFSARPPSRPRYQKRRQQQQHSTQSLLGPAWDEVDVLGGECNSPPCSQVQHRDRPKGLQEVAPWCLELTSIGTSSENIRQRFWSEGAARPLHQGHFNSSLTTIL